MAVLNPPRVLPGLGRSIVNFLLESRATWDEGGLVSAFIPEGVNESTGAADAVTNTLSAFRAIGILETRTGGTIAVTEGIAHDGRPFSRDGFRRVTLSQVFDMSRDGDPWAIDEGEASTSGARDLTRALSWFLAQNALGAPLTWNENVQTLQAKHFGTSDNADWPFANDTRWGAFMRWATALGLAVPSLGRSTGLVPLPTVAVDEALAGMPAGRVPIQDLLDHLAARLPVLPGGVVRVGLVRRLGADPDPGLQAGTLDTSIAQALRILASRGRLSFETLADADGVRLSRTSTTRTTHASVKGGKRK